MIRCTETCLRREGFQVIARFPLVCSNDASGYFCFEGDAGAWRANKRMQSDRFAREIMAILALSDAARLRRLMRNPLGGWDSVVVHPFSITYIGLRCVRPLC